MQAVKISGATSIVGQPVASSPDAAASPADRGSDAASEISFPAAIQYHRAGRLKEAAELYREVLRRDPDHLQTLMLLGLIEAAGVDLDAAETRFTRYIALVPGDPLALHNLGKLHQDRGDDRSAVGLFERALASRTDFAPTFNDLGVSLHRLRRHDAALAALDRAVAVDPHYAVAWSNRSLVLSELDRAPEAASSFRRCLTLQPESAATWCHLAAACYKSDDLPAAEEACRRALALDPGHGDARLQLAQTLDRAHRPEEAEREGIEWARRRGTVVKPCTGSRAEATVLLIAGSRQCNVPVEYLFGADRFATITVHLLPPGEPGADDLLHLDRLPPFDLAFNAIGDADKGGALLEQAAVLCRDLDRPLLNPMNRIGPTRRELLPALLAGIPGLVVPDTRRLTRGELAALADAAGPLDRPWLIRPTGSHGGDDLRRIERREEIADYLRGVPQEEFYLTPFWDFQSPDGLHRKYRFIFVDREVFSYHLAISDHWLIHYWRADMGAADWMKREEEAFLRDHRSAFPAPLGDAVREVARRLDLDYGGMDCALTADGRVLVFEANATMLIHLNESRDEFPYKHRYVPRIADAVSRMVARRLEG